MTGIGIFLQKHCHRHIILALRLYHHYELTKLCSQFFLKMISGLLDILISWWVLGAMCKLHWPFFWISDPPRTVWRFGVKVAVLKILKCFKNWQKWFQYIVFTSIECILSKKNQFAIEKFANLSQIHDYLFWFWPFMPLYY